MGKRTARIQVEDISLSFEFKWIAEESVNEYEEHIKKIIVDRKNIQILAGRSLVLTKQRASEIILE